MLDNKSVIRFTVILLAVTVIVVCKLFELDQWLSVTDHSMVDGPVKRSKIGLFKRFDFTGSSSKAGSEINGALFMTIMSSEEAREALLTIANVESHFNHQYKYDWVILAGGRSLHGAMEDLMAVTGDNIKIINFKTASLDVGPGSVTGLEIGDKPLEYPAKFKVRATARNRKLTRMILSQLYDTGLMDYDYYWRIPAGASLGCDVGYDVFEYMQLNDIKYGWLLAHKDFQGSQPEVMSVVKQYFDNNKVNTDMLKTVLDVDNWQYNSCSVMPEFELVDISFLKSQQYKRFIEYLDDKRVIQYNGWREPIFKTIAMSLLDTKQVKFFDDLAVEYPGYGLLNCPVNPLLYKERRCACDPYKEGKTFTSYKVKRDYEIMHSSECVRRMTGDSPMIEPVQADIEAEGQGEGQAEKGQAGTKDQPEAQAEVAVFSPSSFSSFHHDSQFKKLFV